MGLGEKDMKCPFCGYTESKVIDSRPAEEGATIRRRRECLACQKRFTTYEIIERLPLVVVKRDGKQDPKFMRDYSSPKRAMNAIREIVKYAGFEW